jgi:hypothetical protein
MTAHRKRCSLSRSVAMLDAVVVIATLIVFVALIAFTVGCERL